jgi:hypothetical protein
MEADPGEMPGTGTPLPEHRAPSAMELRAGGERFRILDLGHDTCLIETAGHGPLRGYADIFEGDTLKARCLIELAEPEGVYLRCRFKRRTVVRSTPPVDFPL